MHKGLNMDKSYTIGEYFKASALSPVYDQNGYLLDLVRIPWRGRKRYAVIGA